MLDAGEGHHEDFMRAFFRLNVQDLGALLPRVNDIVKRSAYEVTQSLTENLPQANDIVLVRLTSIAGVRNLTQALDNFAKRCRLPELQFTGVWH